MTDFDCLRLHVDDHAGVATLVLARPDKLNALSQRLLVELVEACRQIDDQDDIKVVHLCGEGRAFCAGFDLGDFAAAGDAMSARTAADRGRLATEALAALRAVTVVELHGHCIGGGVVLAAACDLRVAASDTSFAIPELDLGIPLAWGGIPRLVRELGPAVTKELVMTARRFDAAEAKQLRFLNAVVEPDELSSSVVELVAKLASQPRFALRTTKAQVDAVSEEMAGTRRNANDADILVTAAADPESVAAAQRYLGRRS